MRHALALLLFCSPLAGCPNDPASGETDDVLDDALDTSPSPSEVIGDGLLTGSHLVATTTRWASTLDLCVRSPSTVSIEDARAYKARITLPPQVRGALTLDALEDATVVATVVERSPFSADHHRPTATSAVTQWELRRYADHDTMVATIDHTFEGLGTITESYEVTRRADEPSDVVVDEASTEVAFSWRPAGRDEGHALVPCNGSDEGEEIIDVVGVALGDYSSVLIRVHHAFSGADGSLTNDVRHATTLWQGELNYLSGIPASGYWAHSQGKHHDGRDITEVDRSRDLAAWQLVYKLRAAGNETTRDIISKVHYLEGRDDLPGTIEISRLNSDGTTSKTTSDTKTRPRRIDAPFLAREYADCASPTIGALWSDHVPMLQVAFCPSVSGPRGLTLAALVPIGQIFPPQFVGQVFAGTAIVNLPDGSGWTVRVGAHRVVVVLRDDGRLDVDVLTDGDVSVVDPIGQLRPLRPVAGENDQIHVTSLDDDVELVIERSSLRSRGVASIIYALSEVVFRWGERHHRIRAWDALDYTNTHHNWDDSLQATTPDGDIIHWRYDFYDPVTAVSDVHRVWVTDAGGEILLPETLVYPASSEP
jgi:hypothetical protein